MRRPSKIHPEWETPRTLCSMEATSPPWSARWDTSGPCCASCSVPFTLLIFRDFCPESVKPMSWAKKHLSFPLQGTGAASFDEFGNSKYQNRRTMSSSDRAMLNAFKEISTMADRINLPRNIVVSFLQLIRNMIREMPKSTATCLPVLIEGVTTGKRSFCFYCLECPGLQIKQKKIKFKKK